jgi:hypothetical protein
MKYAQIIIKENTPEKRVEEITIYDKHGKIVSKEERTRKKK